jgi:hypothetical protein
LIGPEVSAAGARQLMLAASPKKLPCVLLVDPKLNVPLVPSIAALASAVIPLRQVESVLALVGFHTGLMFSKDARASIEAPVRVSVGKEELILETTNLSVSGLAISGMPRLEAGTLTCLELDLPFGTVHARAKMIRWAKEGKRNIAGLVFTELALVDRERIAKLVEAARREAPATQLRVADLFGDLALENDEPSALSTSDIGGSIDLPDVEVLLDVHHECALLERWATRSTFPSVTPEWLQAVSGELAQIELASLVGQPAPDWVRPATMMRLCLARARHDCGDGRLPSVISQAAYRMFMSLADCAAGAPASLVTQIAKIRASLLRDLLGTHRLVRAGAGAAPVARVLGRTPAPSQVVSR